MLIDGFGITKFRSFGKQLQQIGPFTKINLLVGQNNSGKSNILLFIRDYYHRVLEATKSGQRLILTGLDMHLGLNSDGEYFSFCLPLDGNRYNELMSKLPDDRRREIANYILHL